MQVSDAVGPRLRSCSKHTVQHHQRPHRSAVMPASPCGSSSRQLSYSQNSVQLCSPLMLSGSQRSLLSNIANSRSFTSPPMLSGSSVMWLRCHVAASSFGRWPKVEGMLVSWLMWNATRTRLEQLHAQKLPSEQMSS